jgi:hypothetical protein
MGTDLERLGIPVLDLSYGRHVAEIMWQLVKLLDTMCEADGKLLWVGIKSESVGWREYGVSHLRGTGWP